jgi:basic membrane lipoprotein Med (substrate-binding protein (PBP1-ABC) superfamily)
MDRATIGLIGSVDTAEIVHGVQTQTASVDPEAPESDVDSLAARIRRDGVGIVVVQGDGPGARALAEVVRSLPETRFVFVDASLDELALDGAPNAAAIRFADEDVMYLVGYLSGLMRTMSGSKSKIDAVSVVAAEPTRDTARLVSGFERGVRATRPGVDFRVDYSHEVKDPSACERLSNRQIDEGSDVVVALSGRCGLGAIAVASTRGVWAVGADEDGVPLGRATLMTTHKEWTIATAFAIDKLLARALPMGRDTVLGLEDDYAVGVWFNNRVPESIASAVILRCSQIRAERHRDL